MFQSGPRGDVDGGCPSVRRESRTSGAKVPDKAGAGFSVESRSRARFAQRREPDVDAGSAAPAASAAARNRRSGAEPAERPAIARGQTPRRLQQLDTESQSDTESPTSSHEAQSYEVSGALTGFGNSLGLQRIQFADPESSRSSSFRPRSRESGPVFVSVAVSSQFQQLDLLAVAIVVPLLVAQQFRRLEQLL